MTRIALAVLTALVLSATVASAEQRTTIYRNALGQEVGRADRQGGTTTFYDSMGRQTGRAEQRRDGTTIYYDNMGRQIGTSRERR